jgi:hypothetical protein
MGPHTVGRRGDDPNWEAAVEQAARKAIADLTV